MKKILIIVISLIISFFSSLVASNLNKGGNDMSVWFLAIGIISFVFSTISTVVFVGGIFDKY